MISDLFYTGFTTERKTNAIDAGGAEADTWATNLTTYSGRLRELSGTEIIANGKRGISATHRHYCASGTDITVKDRLLYESITYQVVDIDDPHELGEFLQIDVILNETEY